METLDSPALVLAVAALASVLGFREAFRRRSVERACDSMQSGHQAALRLLRLAASDQRNVALALFGHAQSAQPPDGALTGLARRLLDLSEDITEQTETPEAPRHLQEEDIQLMPMLEFAMAQVATHLGPGRRTWRVEPSLAKMGLKADRRAMNQILVNVLSGAAATTRHGDWIELSGEPSPDGWSLVVQDEGIGLPVSASDAHHAESRGIGLRLTLARSLMQAHDGTLTVESAERIGTRVRLRFPAGRVLGEGRPAALPLDPARGCPPGLASPQRAPLGQSTTRSVCSRISRSKRMLKFFT
jgi:signal transduction histidine kinase